MPRWVGGDLLKTVVGVDLGGLYAAALDLAVRLDIPGQEFDLVHVVEPMPTYTPVFSPMPVTAVDWMGKLRDAGEAEVEKAERMACDRGAKCESRVIDGAPAASLIEHADKTNADLIAIGSGRLDRVSAALFGSVGRGLTVGAKQSLLVSKTEEIKGSGPISAVLATDHSEYANRCLEKLIAWSPKGLRKITVLTAYELDEGQAERLRASVANVDSNADQWIERQIHGRCEEVAGRVKALGAETEVRVERGHPNTVLPSVMESTGADLLIVGAQGHGFLERLLIGSVSLHQVMNEPYPVLLIRV